MPSQAPDDAGQAPKAADDASPQNRLALLLAQEDKGGNEAPPKADPSDVAMQTDDGAGPGKEPKPATKPEAEPVDVESEAAEDTPPAKEDETTEDEVEPESEPDAEDEEPETPPAGRTHKGADGKDVFVSDDETHAGYLRTQDYTRKTQAAAELKKSAEAAEASAREARAQYIATLGKMNEALAQLNPKEPNWEELRGRLSAAEYAAQHADWTELTNRRKLITDARDTEIRKEAEAQAKDKTKRVETEYGLLLDAVPTWQDADVRTKEFQGIQDDLLARGFSKQNVDDLDDHRLFLLARDAMLYRKLEAAKPLVEKKLQPKIKPAVPGVPKAPKPVDQKKRDLDALKQSRGDRQANRAAAPKALAHLLED